MDVFKILKLRNAISLYNQFAISTRKETALISPTTSSDFVSRSSTMSNIIAPRLKLFDYSHKISVIKNTVKKALMSLQHAENRTDWTSTDYNIKNISLP